VSLRLGPTPWWTTRLHLAAALASDFTEILQFVLFDEHGRFSAYGFTWRNPAGIDESTAKTRTRLPAKSDFMRFHVLRN
jgi:hypothetical protein